MTMTATTDCDQCRGAAWVRICGHVTGALCGYETVTECQACNPDGHIRYAGNPELHVAMRHHLAHFADPGVFDPTCPACTKVPRP